jgi:hypothetical protein
MSTPDTCPIGHVSINVSEIVDGLYYGYALSTALFGVTIVQAWNYFNTNADGWLMRSLVSPAYSTRLRASRRPLSVGSVSSVRNLSSDFFFGIS